MAVLHIGHSWGGGLNRWVDDFMTADERQSFLLTSSGSLASYSLNFIIKDKYGLNIQSLTPKDPIHRAQLTSPELYQWTLDFIKKSNVDTVIYSAPFGFSLNLLHLPVKKIIVLHDFSYVCAGTYGYFNKPCVKCTSSDLKTCIETNPGASLYSGVSYEDFKQMREFFVQNLSDVVLVAPSTSAAERINMIENRLLNQKINIVPHGLSLQFEDCFGQALPDRKLKIAVMGSYYWHKGWGLFDQIHEQFKDRIDFYALGCGPLGQDKLKTQCVDLVVEYKNNELPGILKKIKPDAGLLISLVPETFSYTYSELSAARIPVIASRLGALPERMVAGTGFLVEPTVESIAQCLNDVLQDRSLLISAYHNLKTQTAHSVKQMVKNYINLLDPQP